MKFAFKTLVITALFSVSVSQPIQAQKFVPLFDGKTLEGWQGYGGDPSQNWAVKDGTLLCTGEPGATWIFAKKQYSNFELKLEFNVPENANSGIFIRSPKAGDPWVTGIEIQLLDDFGDKWKGLSADQYTGAIYGVIGPKNRVTLKAGKWQSIKIRIENSECIVWVNKQKVVEENLAKLSKTFSKKVPGLLRKTGLIGLQNHGDKVSFRNIQIKEIQSK